MAGTELEQLIAGLRAGGPDLAAPATEARAGFEALLATLPVADDILFEPVVLGTVSGLRATSPAAQADRALLYLHGGGFVVGSAQGYRGLAAELGRASGAVTYAIDYRLAPEHRFPAALDDAVAAYQALIALGHAPERISVAGDSAGGGLALSLLVALRDQGLPPPSAALLISPWTNLACDGATMTSKAAEDPSLQPEALSVCAERYLGGADPQTPLASPRCADLHGLPPLLIQVGSAEILLDDAVTTAGAAGAAGTSVRLEIWPGMVHVWHAFAFMMAEGRQAVTAAGAFLAEHLAARD